MAKYRKSNRSKRTSSSCRNHPGSCSWCVMGRTHSSQRRSPADLTEQMAEYPPGRSVDYLIIDDVEQKPMTHAERERLAELMADVRDLLDSQTKEIEMGSPPKPQPPIGIMSRRIWDGQRKVALLKAMLRYEKNGETVPKDWVDEYADLRTKNALYPVRLWSR